MSMLVIDRITNSFYLKSFSLKISTIQYKKCSTLKYFQRIKNIDDHNEKITNSNKDDEKCYVDKKDLIS